MKTHTKALVVGAAMAGLFSGSAARVHAAAVTDLSKAGIAIQKLAESEKGKHSCKGHNSCKGEGGCKSGDNGCKGKNSCKGKGGCATDGSKPSGSPSHKD